MCHDYESSVSTFFQFFYLEVLNLNYVKQLNKQKIRNCRSSTYINFNILKELFLAFQKEKKYEKKKEKLSKFTCYDHENANVNPKITNGGKGLSNDRVNTRSSCTNCYILQRRVHKFQQRNQK